MQSLNVLVQERRVLYLGISDTPAWVVAKANGYALAHGLRPFSVYQGRFSAQARDLEGDIIPMCRDQGMAILAWGVMGNGKSRCRHPIYTLWHLKAQLLPGYFRTSDPVSHEPDRQTNFITIGREDQVSRVLDRVARRLETTIYEVAIAYVMHKVLEGLGPKQTNSL